LKIRLLAMTAGSELTGDTLDESSRTASAGKFMNCRRSHKSGHAFSVQFVQEASLMI